MSECFPIPRPLGVNVKIELDLSNYGTKADLKNGTGVDTSKSAKRVDLANLKSKIDKLDIGRLETTPVDLSKLNDVVKDNFVTKSGYDKLVKEVNAIQAVNAGNLVKKTDNNKKSSEIEKKILDHDHLKYISNQEFNKLTADNFAVRLAQANLATKADIAVFVKEISQNKTCIG